MFNLGAAYKYGDLEFYGVSLSGIRTSITIPNFGICFDVANGLPFSINLKKYFITHGHLDHASGIPYIISQKAMHNAPAPDFYMPNSLVAPMTLIMDTWEKIEKHQYKYKFHGIDETSVISINPFYEIRPFKTIHRVESFGYSLVNKNKRLKPEFDGKSQAELKKIRESGVELSEAVEKYIVSFTGDTEIEFLDLSPQIRQSKILFLETTYLDSTKSIQNAKDWGHIHLDELIPRLKSIESEKIVLIHISSRYSTPMALEILNQKIPAEFKDRVVLFPGR